MKKGDYVRVDENTVVVTIQVKTEIGLNSPYKIWSTRIIYCPSMQMKDGLHVSIGQYYEMIETPSVKVVKPIFIEE